MKEDFKHFKKKGRHEGKKSPLKSQGSKIKIFSCRKKRHPIKSPPRNSKIVRKIYKEKKSLFLRGEKMDGWMQWEGKKVFIETRSGRKYAGKVIKVEISKNCELVWISIHDKFGKKITFAHSEINLIQEEN